jgi:hypothetical protein
VLHRRRAAGGGRQRAALAENRRRPVGGLLATECLARALHDYSVRERPNFVLEATLPDAGGTAVSDFLSTVSSCLSENALEPVTIELTDHTYVLGD